MMRNQHRKPYAYGPAKYRERPERFLWHPARMPSCRPLVRRADDCADEAHECQPCPRIYRHAIDLAHRNAWDTPRGSDCTG